MNDPSRGESVRAQMRQLRRDIGGEMDDLAASARHVVDWKHYVKTYPWVCLGAAVALGFLIVPSRATRIRRGLLPLTEPAATGSRIATTAPAAVRRWVETLLDAVAAVAIHTAAAVLSHSVERSLRTGNRRG